MKVLFLCRNIMERLRRVASIAVDALAMGVKADVREQTRVAGDARESMSVVWKKSSCDTVMSARLFRVTVLKSSLNAGKSTGKI